MKQLLSFIKKEFYHIFRDTRTIMILLVMPIIQIILFGFAITTEVKNARVAVFDPSKDVSTERIIHQIDASDYFTVTQALQDPTQIDKIFKEGHTNLVMVFSEHFDNELRHTGKASVQLIADATDPNQALQLTGYATNIIAAYQQELMSQQQVPIQIIPEIRMLYNPQMKAAYNFVPGVMGMILMLICAMMTAIAIAREKESGTMEILLVSPMKPLYVILSKVAPYFTLSIANLATILLLSVFVLKVPVTGSLFWLITVSLIYILVALALGILISTIVESQVAAMLVSGMGLMMPVMLLSGMMFPVENMPWLLRGISHIVPARWYISAVKKLMIEGLPIYYALKEVAILAGMAVLLIFVSLKKFKMRLE